VQTLRRGREQYAADERVLGSSAFVEALQRDVATQQGATRRSVPIETLLQRVCAATGVSPVALQQGSRLRAVCRAREGMAYLAVEVSGYSGAHLAPFLGVRLPAVHKAAQRGREARIRWEQVLKSIKI
jgi:chromosomal replication initiation ATPase DnaA